MTAEHPLNNLAKGEGLSASVEKHLQPYLDAHEATMPSSGLYDLVIKEVERPLLRLVLSHCQGNQLRAAALLGVNRNTLRKKMRLHGLLPEKRERRGRRAP